MTDHEAAETLRAMAERKVPRSIKREIAALDTALQALALVERMADDMPWVHGTVSHEPEHCRWCGSTSRTREHPATDRCLWLAARAVCPGPPEER